MADNRHRHANTVPIAKFFACLVVGACACAAGLGYVWCKNQLYTTGEKIKKCEVELKQLRLRNEAVGTSIATLTSTKELQRRHTTGWIKLVPITGDQIVMVSSATKSAGRDELRPVANERKQE